MSGAAERCRVCDELTGRAGKGDDSLYVARTGPFCQRCYDAYLAPSTAPADVAERDGFDVAVTKLENAVVLYSRTRMADIREAADRRAATRADVLARYNALSAELAAMRERAERAEKGERAALLGMQVLSDWPDILTQGDDDA